MVKQCSTLKNGQQRRSQTLQKEGGLLQTIAERAMQTILWVNSTCPVMRTHLQWYRTSAVTARQTQPATQVRARKILPQHRNSKSAVLAAFVRAVLVVEVAPVWVRSTMVSGPLRAAVLIALMIRVMMKRRICPLSKNL